MADLFSGLRPYVESTPESCAEVLRALDVALRRFECWNIAPPRGTWVQEAQRWLRHVAQSNSLGSTDAELQRTSAATAMAMDLYHISTCLGDEANRQVGAELAKLANGSLPGPGHAAKGKDFLAQFWIGALLAQSKLEPQIPAFDRPDQSKPDFYIVRGGVRFAIEVKRPETRESARRAMLRAGKQLHGLSRPGIIVIDATDCVSLDPWAIYDDPLAREHRSADLEALHNELRHEIEGYSRSSKFSEISMLLTLARHWNWYRRADGELKRDAGILLRAYGFGYLWSVQVTELTRQIQDALLVGIEQLTGNRPQARYS